MRLRYGAIRRQFVEQAALIGVEHIMRSEKDEILSLIEGRAWLMADKLECRLSPCDLNE